jgi:hypothetical protein
MATEDYQIERESRQLFKASSIEEVSKKNESLK